MGGSVSTNKKPALARRRSRRSQTGAALWLFLILLVLGVLGYTVESLSPATLQARRAQVTADSLARARDALLGYALRYRDAQAAKDTDSTGEDDRAMYGYLPLPDLGSRRNNNIDPNCLDTASNPLEGCDANVFTGLGFDSHGIGPSVVGRFPWRTLGIEPLRDGHGECLWLAVSALHGRIQGANPTLPPMNWDTLGQFDIVVANGTASLVSALKQVHDRPVAILFAPGPPLPGQNRAVDASSGNDVRQCGGNYHAANYLDPALNQALGGPTNYLDGAQMASGPTGDSDPSNDPDTPKSMVLNPIYARNGLFLPDACASTDCVPLANDTGLRLTSDTLFGAIRNNANFRLDINTLLDKTVTCLRDDIAAGRTLANGKVPDANGNACYGENTHPLGYYPNYREMMFVTGPANVNDIPCAGALLFAGQRGNGQQRASPADKANPANYLEAGNLSHFVAGTNRFAGPDLLERTGKNQSAAQDIVRCIPTGPSLNQVKSPALDALGGQLTRYDSGTRTLTLGQLFSLSASARTNNLPAFFGCSWTPEIHRVGNGLRGYFRFRIENSGEGFVFAIVDGDRNTANVCGAARQHLGYSGNNGITPAIDYPKIGIEFDTEQSAAQRAAMNPALGDHLNNGRADPGYTGGHFGLVYWGGEASIATGQSCPCAAPRLCIEGACYLPREEDDNVHGLPASAGPTHPAPRNPPAPATPTQGSGIYKLDANLSRIPINQDMHVRIEMTRTASDDNLRNQTWLLEIWLLKDSATDANKIAAMRNTTRAMAQLYPDFAAHVRDTPTIHDIQGGLCGGDADCASGQTCSKTDQRCYAPVFRNARLGFTTSQSTSANDQIIRVFDFATSWIP